VGHRVLAAYSAGCVIVPLDTSQDAAALSEIVAHGECEALIFSERYAGAARQISEATRGLALIEDSCSPGLTQESADAPLPLVARDPAPIWRFFTRAELLDRQRASVSLKRIFSGALGHAGGVSRNC